MIPAEIECLSRPRKKDEAPKATETLLCRAIKQERLANRDKNPNRSGGKTFFFVLHPAVYRMLESSARIRRWIPRMPARNDTDKRQTPRRVLPFVSSVICSAAGQRRWKRLWRGCSCGGGWRNSLALESSSLFTTVSRDKESETCQRHWVSVSHRAHLENATF